MFADDGPSSKVSATTRSSRLRRPGADRHALPAGSGGQQAEPRPVDVMAEPSHVAVRP